MEEILVTICCITYNQERYIKKAVESFLNQSIIKRCEILIHDDASTDKTLSIIQYYAQKYPHIIRIYSEKENQYSKGIPPIKKLFDMAKGKYIAICEGDDYWIDSYKLEKQYNVLERHQDCTMCFHATKIYDQREKKFLKSQHAYKKNYISNIRDIIIMDGGFVPTASIFCKTDIVKSLPDFYYKYMIGDYSLQIIMASKGEVYYIDEEMSVYRRNTELSVVNKLYSNPENEIKMYKDMSQMLRDFNEYSENEYYEIIEEKLRYYEYKINEVNNKLFTLIKKPYREFLLRLSLRDLLRLVLKCIIGKLKTY